MLLGNIWPRGARDGTPCLPSAYGTRWSRAPAYAERLKEKRLLERGEYFTTVGAGSTTAFEAGGRSAPRTRSQAWEVHRVGLGFRVSDQGLYDEVEGALSRLSVGGSPV